MKNYFRIQKSGGLRMPIILTILFTLSILQSNAQIVFANVDSLISYATERSLSIKSGEIELSQAKKAKLAAIYGIPDPSGSLSSTYTNNTKLPVNLFPAEILGGKPGTFQEVKLGVQYITNQNLYADIKLINLSGWENYKLSKNNLRLTETENKITLKTLSENIATAYFNLVTLQEQLKATQSNLSAADTLYLIALHKNQQGLANQQDVNEAKANKLNTEESIRQIQFLITQQYLALKILCDMPENEDIQINQTVASNLKPGLPELEHSAILLENALTKEKQAKLYYRQSLYSHLPNASFFLSQTAQQYNTQARLFDNQVKWIPSSYFGFRLSLPIPTSVSIAQTSKAKYQYLLAQNNTAQVRIKSGLNYRNLQTESEKARSQYSSNIEVYALCKDSYQKNLMNYKVGVAGIDQTINSFNTMINSNYNLISSAIAMLLAETKININNEMK